MWRVGKKGEKWTKDKTNHHSEFTYSGITQLAFWCMFSLYMFFPNLYILVLMVSSCP